MGEHADDRYARIYRKLHPRDFPWSPYERQLELSDLWEADRDKFKQMVDAVDGERKFQRVPSFWKATP